jgi:hypothetical protein
VPVLETLVHVAGSPTTPVQNVSIRGVGFRDSTPTYLKKWGVPSGTYMPVHSHALWMRGWGPCRGPSSCKLRASRWYCLGPIRNSNPYLCSGCCTVVGGDWALYRGGAVVIEGSESLAISNCTFRRLDANAVILTGYNRDALIKGNEFHFIGDTA